MTTTTDNQSEKNLGHFIRRVELHDTGGGCLVDFFILDSGKVIGISDECVVLYSKEQWDDGDLLGIEGAGIINLIVDGNSKASKEKLLSEGISGFVTSVSTQDYGNQKMIDVIHLKDGRALVVDVHNIALSANAILNTENKITSAGLIDLTAD